MDQSLLDPQDEPACYTTVVGFLHPAGLGCPGCGTQGGLYVHRRHRAPVLDYRCSTCGRVFNAWTGTALQGTHRRPSEILRILRAIVGKLSTAQLARNLGRQRATLHQLRRRLERELPLNSGTDPAHHLLPPAGPLA